VSVAAEAYEPVFAGPALARLEAAMQRYPTKQAALLPALWMLQDARGWVSEKGIEEVAAVLDITPAYVKGVVIF
jgi:NADH:ubiquinone oxidoreductase subunit E